MDFRQFLFLCLLLSLYSCAWDQPQFLQEPEILENPNSAAPLVGLLHIKASEPVRAIIEITDGQRSWKLEPQGLYKQVHHIPILQLHPDTEYRFTVQLKDTWKKLSKVSRVFSYRSPPLPDDFPDFSIQVAKAEKRERGFTLFSLVKENQVDGLLVALDTAGKVIWYFQHDQELANLKLCKNKHILAMGRDGYLLEIDYLGNIFREFIPQHFRGDPSVPNLAYPIKAGPFHGDVEVKGWRNYWMLGSEGKEQVGEGKKSAIKGDVLIQFDREGKLTDEIKLMDLFDPLGVNYTDGKTWNSFNSLTKDQRTDALFLLSSEQNILAKMARDTNQLLWIFGDTLGWKAPLKTSLLQANGEVDWPEKMISARFSAHGSLLIVDQEGTQGRIIEYVVHDEQKKIRQTWFYGTDENERFMPNEKSIAERMPWTGNVLLCGQRPGEEQDLIREVTHKERRELVFEMKIGSGYQLNGLIHLPDLKVKMEGE